ncbi:hypothetical protein HO173_012022 [Letharia columbiana]|uniref:Uncharacterized protein n=1 Tax=Letharia columbiana TaxID=112416 RepID=A0A8H6FGH9_9LECA|nr:uncharacterized protein HO173_012022 [Letharia columbiana]KAF6227692.1 hypothetical protein HO173_012022 [Letharia columbiana]
MQTAITNLLALFEQYTFRVLDRQQSSVDPACVDEILHRAGSGSKTAEQIQNVSQAYLVEGDKAYVAGELSKAIARYDHVTELLRHHRCLKLDEDAPRGLLRSLITALHVTSSHTARAILASGDYECAKTLGKNDTRGGVSPKPSAGEGEDELRPFEESLNAEDDKSTVLRALADLFPYPAAEQAGMVMEQHDKLQSGGSHRLRCYSSLLGGCVSSENNW